MPRLVTWKRSDSTEPLEEPPADMDVESGGGGANGNAEAKLANGLSEAMNGESGESGESGKSGALPGRMSLSEVGALPPVDENFDERPADVMSEPPEIDTTREDKPPSVTHGTRICAARVLMFACAASFVVLATFVALFLAGMYAHDCDPGTLLSSNSTTLKVARSACSKAKELVREVSGSAD